MNRITKYFVVAVCIIFSVESLAQLKGVSTVPELGDIIKQVGGREVSITVLAKGSEDPHFVEAKPSFIKKLNQADFYVQVGLQLESGWAPALLQSAHNARLRAGLPGFIDASQVITPLGIPTSEVSRAEGDIHPFGNPHYLLDPINGIKVAQLIANRLSQIDPRHARYYEGNFKTFRRRVAEAFVGVKLARKLDFDKLVILQSSNRFIAFLQKNNAIDQLGGWLGQVQRFGTINAIGDHNSWLYFTNRFHIDLIGFLEPKPGFPPTKRHLANVMSLVKKNDARLILTSAYFNSSSARLVARNTRARVVPMAHSVGSRPNTSTYIGMISFNIKQIAKALRG